MDIELEINEIHQIGDIIPVSLDDTADKIFFRVTGVIASGKYQVEAIEE